MAKKTKQAKPEGSVRDEKAQRKAIQQGIEKGIADYRKNHQAKVQSQDKKLKKAIKAAEAQQALYEEKLAHLTANPVASSSKANWLPWVLLGLSWTGFAVTYFIKNS